MNNMVSNLNRIEVRTSGTPLLDALREELKGLSSKKTIVVRRASARTKIRKIRNAHIATCGAVFFQRNFFGRLEANPTAGKKLIQKMFRLK